jgi:ligand-binding sensor domain-containing protein
MPNSSADHKPPDTHLVAGIMSPRQIGIPPPRTLHSPYAPTQAMSGWRSYASQRQVRDIVIDAQRDCVWLATWGGVLCWQRATQRVERHTSAHGLVGNATRCLALDAAGTVWAAGEEHGLSHLDPQPGALWHPGLGNYRVSQLVPRSPEGVYATVHNRDGTWALAEVTRQSVTLLKQDEVAVRSVEAMLRASDGSLWWGNAWGLHHHLPGTTDFETYPTERQYEERLCSLAEAENGRLWVGTDHGLYLFNPRGDRRYTRSEAWPNAAILSLLSVHGGGGVWAVTSQGIGRVASNNWDPVDSAPPGPISCLVAAPAHTATATLGVWAAGQQGLYALRGGTWSPLLELSTEDHLSNAVQCLLADPQGLWIGSVGGLCRLEQGQWLVPGNSPLLRDVRALAAAPDKYTRGCLWAAAWPNGLHRVVNGVFDPWSPLPKPLIALAAAADGGMWAATIDRVYRQEPGSHQWRAIPPPARQTAKNGAIRALCPAGDDLWVGTSCGLLRYRPKLGDTHWTRTEELGDQDVRALCVDPDKLLWAGTSDGLYGQPDWTELSEPGVLCLAFSQTVRGRLWVGTAQGLKRWSVKQRKREAEFDPENYGLPSSRVVCLAVRAIPGGEEVWAGTSAGLSCLS